MRKVFGIITLMAISAMAYGQAFSKTDPIGTVVEYLKSSGNNTTTVERMILMDKKTQEYGEELTILITEDGSENDKGLTMKYLLTDDALIWDLQNLRNILDKEMEEAENEMQAKGLEFKHSVTGDPISIPLRPDLNKTYKDQKIKAYLKVIGIKIKMALSVSDITVIRKEKIKTPMGTFEAYLVQSNWKMTINTLLIINKSEKFRMSQWIVPELGVVKEIMTFGKREEENKEKMIVKKYVRDM